MAGLRCEREVLDKHWEGRFVELSTSTYKRKVGQSCVESGIKSIESSKLKPYMTLFAKSDGQ
eukprot:4091699-Amphidinium_carterae.1